MGDRQSSLGKSVTESWAGNLRDELRVRIGLLAVDGDEGFFVYYAYDLECFSFVVFSCVAGLALGLLGAYAERYPANKPQKHDHGG